MIYRASSISTKVLLSLPESGMGYQIIESRIIGIDVKRKFVEYNCEVLVDLDKDFKTNKRILIEKNYE